jgi:hypothetical protein
MLTAHHVALELCIAVGKAGIGHETVDGLQGFGNRAFALRGELVTVSHHIRQHNLA